MLGFFSLITLLHGRADDPRGQDMEHEVSVRSHRPAPLDSGQIQRRSEPQTSKGPPEHRNPRRTTGGTTTTPPREELGSVLGEPPSSHSAEAPGSCTNEPTGPVGSRLWPARGPRPAASTRGRRPPPRPRNHTDTPHHCHCNDTPGRNIIQLSSADPDTAAAPHATL
ncbi:hypothetical protein AMECASPLE_034011 [Ameca splendens]|uniref:Uncharacterized protein n=1 Tax=Ameca splendens TaxID=208324 RepID=A0ABV0XJY2_9TELE